MKYHVPSAHRAALVGKRVAIVDDAVSAGSAARGTYADLIACGAQPVALGALFVFGDNAAGFAQEKSLALEMIAWMSFDTWPARGLSRCAEPECCRWKGLRFGLTTLRSEGRNSPAGCPTRHSGVRADRRLPKPTTREKPRQRVRAGFAWGIANLSSSRRSTDFKKTGGIYIFCTAATVRDVGCERRGAPPGRCAQRSQSVPTRGPCRGAPCCPGTR